MRRVVPLLLLLGLPLSLWAQRYHPTGLKSRELLAVSAGTTSFFGDIEGKGPLGSGTFHLGLSYEYKLLSRLGLRASAHWYQLEAYDSDSDIGYLQARNLSFTSSNWEANLLTSIYLFRYRAGSYWTRKRVNAYGLFGFGATLFNPKTVLNGQEWSLREMETEGAQYGRVAITMPFGGGIQYRISPQLDLALQATYHYAFSDYLDDVSGRYRDPDSFENPIAAQLADRHPEMGLNKAEAGSPRGNPNVKDGYLMIGVRGQYYLSRYRFRGREVKKLLQ